MIGNDVCVAPGSLGKHPVGAPDWAGRAACPCGLVRVYPQGSHGLPAELPVERDRQVRRAQPHGNRRTDLLVPVRDPDAPGPTDVDVPHAVVLDLDAARRVKLRRKSWRRTTAERVVP